MPEAQSAGSIELDRATRPRERAAAPLAPLVIIGVLVVLTVVTIRVGDGDISLALAPSLVAMLVLALWRLPLRVPMLILLAAAWAIEAPGDAFAEGLVKTPWKGVGQLLWGQLKDLLPVSALVFTGFDLIVLLLFGVVAYRQLRASTLDRSAEWVDTPRPLGTFLSLSLAAVAWMSVYGLARGGAFRFVLWQSTRWLYLPIVYALTRQGLRGVVDARTVGKLVLGVGLFRAGEAILFRWWFPSLEQLPHATTHADSVLFSTCICILVAMLVEMRGKQIPRFVFLLLPIFLGAMKANNRRLVFAQVAVGLVVMWFMTPWRPLKVKVARILVAAALPLTLIYVPLGWNSDAAIFSPVRKIRSMADPDYNKSTLWRVLENYDSVYTYEQRPLLGSGFGHPFEEVIKLPDITTIYELEPYIPHNSVLGLWAFGGLFGFAVLWAMFPVGLFFTARCYRWARTPLERVTALGAASVQVSYLMEGYGDLGFGAWGPVFTVATAFVLVGKICIANGAWGAGKSGIAGLGGGRPWPPDQWADMGFEVSTLTTVEALRDLEEEWLALLGRVEPDLPFLWPDWVITWWELFRQDRSVIRDSLQLKAVRRDSGELAAIVPLMATDRPAVGPVRARGMGFIGADKYITEQPAPLVDPACEREVGAALAADLRTSRWDWIAWEGLKPETELAMALGREMELRWSVSDAGNVLHLPPSWREFQSRFRNHLKKSVRHCYNSLKREGLTAQLDVATTPEQIGPALEIFLQLQTTLAQHADPLGGFDRFADPMARGFLVQLCSRLARRKMTRVLTLRIRGEPVASRVAFQLPNCLYLYHSGCDPAWRKYAVATTLVAEAIKYAIDSGTPRLHLSMGKDPSKSRWDPEMAYFHRAFWVRPQLSSRLALRVYSWVRHDGSGLPTWIKGVLGRRFG